MIPRLVRSLPPWIAALALVSALAPSPAAAQFGEGEVVQAPPDRPIPPPFYAIRNATVVTGTGTTIEGGTVVIENGLITAVSPNAAVPPEAWVLDGEGLTVYPGLFHALGQLALKEPEEEGDGEGGGLAQLFGGGETAEGPEDRPETYPWRAAADMLAGEADQVEKWREGGFTNAMTVPADGIVAGQGAVVALAGEPGEMVVATPAALKLGLETSGFFSYPGSLFGVMSYLEQLFLDAERYGRAVAAYEASPGGRERPRYDRTLEPVRRAVVERWATLIPGDEPREIRRAIELGDELGVRTVVVGGHGAWRMPAEIAASGAAVLVNLEWPEGPKDPDPEREVPLRELQARVNTPSTPARLESAGVVWAFYPGGVATAKQALEKARDAVDAGLDEEAALRGLTLYPARIYGVDDRTGSIEPGKIANLLVTEGGLFDEKAKVRMVFVDGRKFEIPEVEKPEEPPAADMSGSWDLAIESPQGVREVDAELEMEEDGTLSGTLTSEQGEQTIEEGWVSGESFRWTTTITMGPSTVEATFSGTFEGDEMEGTVSIGGRFSVDFTGERTSGPGGGAR
ncbi:MAG: amidohydrolase family protein [Gemmatimonadota bacterium]|nr:amidohydrolase family protein [Gemmatimonadota bacterium]